MATKFTWEEEWERKRSEENHTSPRTCMCGQAVMCEASGKGQVNFLFGSTGV
jgi:hypothetical protein